MIYLNDHKIKPTVFPDKTSQVWKLPEDVLKNFEVEIIWEFENESELFQLAQLKTLLDSHGITADLYVPYLPYARQDKPVSNFNTFALITFSNIINNLNFRSVECVDAHSNVANKLINNLIVTYPTYKVIEVLKKIKCNLICYPDAGARSKYTPRVYPEIPYIYGKKVRDQQTGIITHYELIGSPKDEVVLIVDDICDGGATFQILTKSLLEQGAKEVNLFVSHGIFSKGLEPLYQAGIKNIYTKEGKK